MRVWEQTLGELDILNTILYLTHIKNNLRPTPRNPRPWLLRRLRYAFWRLCCVSLLLTELSFGSLSKRWYGGNQGTPEGRQDVHPTPWHCTLSHTCHVKAAETKAHRRDTGGTPEGHQGVHPTPWQCTLSHTCHAKVAETKGQRRDTGGIPEGR